MLNSSAVVAASPASPPQTSLASATGAPGNGCLRGESWPTDTGFKLSWWCMVEHAARIMNANAAVEMNANRARKHGGLPKREEKKAVIENLLAQAPDFILEQAHAAMCVFINHCFVADHLGAGGVLHAMGVRMEVGAPKKGVRMGVRVPTNGVRMGIKAPIKGAEKCLEYI